MSGEVVYGRNPVRELLAADRRRVHDIWATGTALDEPWLAGDRRVRGRQKAEIGRAAGSSAHQGIVAFCDPYPYVGEADVLHGDGPVVAVDGADDPRNLGAIARVAEAAGCAGILIPGRGGASVTPVAVKASAGAVEHLAIARVQSLPGALSAARDMARPVVGSDSDGDDFREHPIDRFSVLVLGSEGEGLRPRVRAACDRIVAIPMSGRVESLNVSVAAGVLLFGAPPRG